MLFVDKQVKTRYNISKRLGDAMDCLSDAIADIPINFDEFD